MDKPSILIVEDDTIVSLDIYDILACSGYHVYEPVSSGESALAKIVNNRPDVILMDIAIQGKLDGISTAMTIQERFNIPVIFMTTCSDDGIAEQAEAAELFGYILKPFNIETLHSTIKIAFNKYLKEERIQYSEQILKKIINESPYAILLTDMKKEIVDCNPMSLKLFNYPEKTDLMGKSLIELFCRHEHSRIQSDLQLKIGNDSFKHIEYSMKTDRGTVIDAEVSISPLKFSGKITFFLITLNDVKGAARKLKYVKSEM